MEILDTLNGSYIRGLLKEGKRTDSRKAFDFRSISLKAGVIEHAEGSAQVELGSTKVLAAVKMMPEDPMDDTPGQGNIMVNAELLPLAYAGYETGPPSPEAVELARVVDRGIRAANCIDLQGLALEDKKVWSIFVDLYILNYSGNLFDASYLAAMAALINAKVPKYEEGVAHHEERTKSLKIDNIVTSTTFGKIGGNILLDMNMSEEGTASEIKGMVEESFVQHKKLKSIIEQATQ
jgi:exosome complex component RRP42